MHTVFLIIPSLLRRSTPFHLQLSCNILFDNVWVLIWERHTHMPHPFQVWWWYQGALCTIYIPYCQAVTLMKHFLIKPHNCHCSFKQRPENHVFITGKWKRWMRLFILRSCFLFSDFTIKLANYATPLSQYLTVSLSLYATEWVHWCQIVHQPMYNRPLTHFSPCYNGKPFLFCCHAHFIGEKRAHECTLLQVP